jgi:hypothetical protein
MDQTRRDPVDDPTTRTPIGRRAFFGRALLAAGATTALLGLTGCPGGEQDDDGEDEGDQDDD